MTDSSAQFERARGFDVTAVSTRNLLFGSIGVSAMLWGLLVLALSV